MQEKEQTNLKESGIDQNMSAKGTALYIKT